MPLHPSSTSRILSSVGRFSAVHHWPVLAVHRGDVHAERIVIASLVGQAREPIVSDIPDAKVIRKTFQRIGRAAYELRVCYEAGPCGFEEHRQLTAMGIHCEVVAPSLIPVRVGDRVKTDRRDATKLARLYRAGELTTITVPSAEQEAVRDLVRARDDVRKDLTAARHRLGKFLIRHGRVFHGGRTGRSGSVATGFRGSPFHRDRRGPGSRSVVGHGRRLHRSLGPLGVLPA